MNILKKIDQHKKLLNVYQLNLLHQLDNLFHQLDGKKTNSCNVRFNEDSKILELSITQEEKSNFSILILVHSDMIEISFSNFTYFMDSISSSLFYKLSGNDFYKKVTEFIFTLLKGNFSVTFYYNSNNSLVQSEINWIDNKYPSMTLQHSLLNFFQNEKNMNIKKINPPTYI